MKIEKNYTIKHKLKNRCGQYNLNKTKKYSTFKKWTKTKERISAMEYISKSNLPLLPKDKQVVIGTTKFLLPYFYLNKHFNVLAVDDSKWTIQDNNNFIHTIGLLNEPIIRLITTPGNLINKKNKLRITSIELCILFEKYNYEIFRLNTDDQYYGNIYFLIKKNNKIKFKKSLEVINRNTQKVIYL
jgi:hypothetical protein